MSHEIQKLGDMVYVGEKPWHDMGVEVSELMELPDCLAWETLKKEVRFDNGDEFEAADNYRALVRSDTGALLSIASDSYQPHQNRDLWETFRRFAAEGDMKIETAGALKGGRIIWALARIDKSFSANGDKHDLFALMTSRHDAAGASLYKPVAERVVCHNTLNLALSEKSATLSQSHKSKFDGRAASEFVASAILGFEDYESKVNRMQAADLNGYSRAVTEAFVAELLAPKLLADAIEATGKRVNVEYKKSFLDEIVMFDESRKLFVESIEENGGRAYKIALHDQATEQNGIAGKTAFGLLNGITRYVDHTYGRNADNRLSNAWLGAGETLKQSALDLAIEYTNALRA